MILKIGRGKRPLKTVSLGPNLKLPKTCQTLFYNHIRVVLCKKPLQKTPNIRKMRPFWKSAKLAMRQRLYIAFAIEMLNLGPRVVLCKNPLQKYLIFEKWDHFENRQSWPWGKGCSLCKMVSLGPNLKLQKRCEKRFYDHIRVVLCKRNRSKNTYCLKSETTLKISKIGHEAKAIAFAKCSL